MHSHLVKLLKYIIFKINFTDLKPIAYLSNHMTNISIEFQVPIIQSKYD